MHSGAVPVQNKLFEPIKLSLQRVSELTGESTSVIYDAINAGHLHTFLVGRRRFARPDAIRAWVDFLQAQSDAGRPVCYRRRGAARLGLRDMLHGTSLVRSRALPL